MRIHLRDQQLHLQEHLVRLKEVPVVDLRDAHVPEKIFTTPLEHPINDTDHFILHDYHIFPRRILQALPEWQVLHRAMRVGDTIAQQIQLPPLLAPSLKIVFGVRISEIIQGPERFGFSYATLAGHVEVGTSTFTFECLNGRWSFNVRVRSAPGNFWTELVGPTFTMPYRNWSIRQALARVRALVACQHS